MGLVAPQHVRSSWTRAQTCVRRIGRRILNHCATREALSLYFKAINVTVKVLIVSLLNPDYFHFPEATVITNLVYILLYHNFLFLPHLYIYKIQIWDNIVHLKITTVSCHIYCFLFVFCFRNTRTVFFVVVFLKFIFIYLFLAVLGLRFCVRAFSSYSKRGPLFIAVRGPLTIAASLVAEHRLQTRRLSSCGSRA